MRTTDFGDDKDRVLIKSDGELTYFASDTAYYLNKRARGFDHCIYLLGADHHGYVGRLRAMAACVGDDPDVTLDVLIGQLVKILQRRRRAQAVQAGRHDRHPRRARRGDRRRRAALLAGPLPGRLAAGARRRRDHQGLQRQPRLLRAVRPRPHLPDDGATPPTSGCRCPTTSTLRCWPTSATATCCARWRSSRGWWPARPSCASRTGSRATWRSTAVDLQPVVRHQECRMLPQGDEPVDAGQRGAPGARRGHPHGARQRPRPARRLGAGADVSRHARSRGRLGARRRSRSGARRGCASPATSTRWCRSCGRSTARKVDGALEVGGVPADRPGRRARLPGVRPGRGRLPRARPRLPRRASPAATSTTPARRSCARRSPAGSPRRGSASTSAPAASWRSPCAPGSRWSGSASTATTSPWPSSSGPSSSGVGRIIVDSFHEIDRLAALGRASGRTAAR